MADEPHDPVNPMVDNFMQQQNQRTRITFLLAALGVSVFLLVAATFPFQGFFGALFEREETEAQVPTFTETFDGAPTSIVPWTSPNWDIAVHSRNQDTFYTLNPMDAHHGPGCEAPQVNPALPVSATNPLVTHPIDRTYEGVVFNCKNHLMTGLGEIGYGLITLTPNHMVDFSAGEAVIRMDVSTFVSTTRDYWDVWVTPMEDSLVLPLDSGFGDLQGEPRRALNFRVQGPEGITHGEAYDINNFVSTQFTAAAPGYQSVLTPDPARRDTFEIRISRTHIKFWMPQYNLVWVDRDIPPLDWDHGIVQIGTHSYTPTKGCLDTLCRNTWHWDNVSISPSAPFTMIKSDRALVDAGHSGPVTFQAPAPTNSHLRFAAESGTTIQVSLDNGANWQTAQIQPGAKPVDVNKFISYWVSVPQGTQSVMLRGTNGYANTPWIVRDVSIFSPEAPAGGTVTGTATPAPTIVPTSTPVVVSTATPTPRPSVTPAPTVTATSTPAPAGVTPTGATLGNTTIGTTLDTNETNYMTGSRFTTGASGATVSSLSTYVGSPVATSPNNQYQLAIYTDSSGRPGTLVASSTSGTLVANSWNTRPVSATLAANTSYWLMYNTNGNSTTANNMRYNSSGAGGWRTQTFGSWPSTFGTATTSSSRAFSIYATLGASTTTPTPVQAPIGGISGFSCTEFIGYSQTDNWYGEFEQALGTVASQYQLLWNGGGSMVLWQDPNYVGWSNPRQSPCSVNTTAPDRVVLDVTHNQYLSTGNVGSDPVGFMENIIRNAINTTRGRYPSVRQFVLQPVVGAPNHTGTCPAPSPAEFGVVRATYNHPVIYQAIDRVVASPPAGVAVMRGLDNHVGDCSQYVANSGDFVGHLTQAGQDFVGPRVASFFSSISGSLPTLTVISPTSTPTPRPTSTPTPTPLAQAIPTPTSAPILITQVGSRVAWQGGNWYVMGANVPWYNWACDFGCGSAGGVSGNRATLSTGFARMRDAGMHVARWWVFPGDPWQITRNSTGAPIGLNPAIYADFDAALQLAQTYDLYFDFVLFNAATAPPRSWLTDPTQRAQLAQVLGPLFARYRGNPRILSWEIFNEPEFQIWNNQIGQTEVVETGRAIADSVHANSTALVTVGHAMLDGMPMWANVNLDYYSPHWYQYMSSGNWCAICQTVSQARARWPTIGTKPIVIGEMYAGSDASPLNTLNTLYTNGYAGTWAWSLFPDRTSDRLAIDMSAVTTFDSQHADIGP